MLRKLLALVGVAVLASLLVPSAANAQTAGVAVFTGDAQVGQNQGDGLCFPGLDPAAGCQPNPGVVVPVNDWAFTVPAVSPIVLPGNIELPSVCIAVGAANSDVAGAPGADGSNCGFQASGTVGANLLGVGPSCGMSFGTGGGDFFVNGLAATQNGTLSVQWPTSAGGTLPIIGSIDWTNGGDAALAGVVQARPIPQGGGVPCLTEPATTFTVVGAVALAGA